MTAEENREDLVRHADDFRDRRGFTYTVLNPAEPSMKPPRRMPSRIPGARGAEIAWSAWRSDSRASARIGIGLADMLKGIT
jgi:hypothetical protein